MANEREVILKFKIEGLGEEVKNVEEMAKAMNNVGKETKEVKKDATFVDDLKAKFGPVTDAVKKFGATLKATNIFKLLGIGLVITAISSLIAYFKRTEEGSRKLQIAIEAVKILFDKLLELLGWVGEKIVKVFEDPIGSVKKLGQMIVDNIVERFRSLLDVVGYVGEALYNLFTGEFSAALESVKNAGKEMVDVFTGVDGTVDKVVEGVTEGFKEIKKAVMSAVEAATALVDAQRNLRNLQQKLIKENAQLNQTLELQQKIAEDTTLSYEERKAALEEVGKAQVALAANVQQQAAAQVNLLELQKQATSNYEEQEELETQIAEAIAARTEAETQLLIKKQDAAKITRELDQEELDRKQSITQMITDLENGLIQDQFARARKELEAQETAQMAELTRLRATEEEKKKVADAYSEKRKLLAAEEAKYKMEMEQKVKDNQLELASSALGAISKLVGEGTAVGKAAAVAQTTIDTYAAAQGAYKSQMALATPDAPVRAAIAAGIAIANGLANVRAIIKTKTPGAEAGAAGTPGKPSFQSFNPTQMLASTAAGQNTQTEFGLEQRGTQNVIKAYVVADDMTSQQEANKKINNLTRLGR